MDTDRGLTFVRLEASPKSLAVPCLAAVLTGWAVVLALVLSRPTFVSHDTISNYAHVWYVSDRLWHAHQLPWHMPIIGHGRAFAFPYAFIPWLTAALGRPLLGDWVVTLWLVLGCVGVAGATLWAFPEIRAPGWAATALLNPALITACVIGQLPFLWASALLLAGVGCWRRGRRAWAATLVGLGQATHPAVVLPIGLALVAAWAYWERDRLALIRWYAVAVLITLPAAALVVASPVFRESRGPTIATEFFGTIVVRVLVVAVPVGLCVARARRGPWLGAAAAGVLIGLNVALIGPLDLGPAWSGLLRHPDTEVAAFARSPSFRTGATYRLLRSGDFKVGMYQLIQHGGRLDSELFPESIDRRSWPTLAAYAGFLRDRGVDYVLVFDSYDRRFQTNEHELVRRLVTLSQQRAATGLVGARLMVDAPQYDLYRIDRGRGKARGSRARADVGTGTNRRSTG